MRAAVISDTHDLLRQEVTDIMESCDVIIHAGDVNTQKLAEQLEKKKPLYLVRGNNDGEWASGLPETLWFELEGVSFYMIHNKREIPEVRREADVIIYGHTHNYDCQKEGNTLWLNPGSCGKRRFSLPITMAVLELHNGSYEVERIDLPLAEESAPDRKNTNLEEIYTLERGVAVKRIMKGMDRGESIRMIAEKWRLPENFVEQVCRIRVTHPGVNAAGIVDKMEANDTIKYAAGSHIRKAGQ